MLILIGLLASYRIWLGRHRPTSRATRLSLIGLANRNGGRNPHRSVLTAGLLAVAGFMILAMGAFRIDPNPSGAGGFDLTATTVQPIYRDLNQPEVLDELLGKRDAERVAGAQFLMIRERSGQDASCNNLYQATQPRVLGLPPAIEGLQQSASDVAFAWAAGDRRIVWEQLKQKASGGPEDPIPVVIDQNTAMWSLQMMRGVGQEKGFDYPGSGLIYFRVVGLLANSLLQGSLLISEENFIHVFPNVTGYQRILIRSDGASANTLTEVLENRLSDSGVDVQDSMSQLARLLEVQNTYLRTFQGLGAIGLLLGTFGLAVAQTRSVIERRGELALLRAVGFADRRLANLVLWETVQLLLGGLTLAIVSASLALVPFAVLGQAQVGWQEPMAFLAVALACGLAVSILAIHRALAVPLLPALRGL